MSQLLGFVLAAQLTDDWRRLKVCRNEDCAWSFYDSSRNRGGTWCSMQECGNRLKNRDYRERQRRLDPIDHSADSGRGHGRYPSASASRST